MLLKSKFVRIVCSLCLVFSLAALCLADTIRLKDGSIIKGKIVNYTGGQFTVVFGDGARQRRMNFFADEIESIEFDGTSIPIASVKTSTQLPVKSNSQTNNPNTIINVGDKNNPVTSSPTTNTNSTSTETSNPGYTNKIPTNVSLPPIQVKVLADNTANGWTSSGFMVKKGDRVKITGKGSVSLGNGTYATPNGISSLADKDKLMKTEATGGLIAVIGDDNDEFIFVGTSKEFVATRDGLLFLGVNEGVLDDNSGSFDVSIEIARK